MAVMNPYGQQAWDHWKTWRPRELSQIPDPMENFADRLRTRTP